MKKIITRLCSLLTLISLLFFGCDPYDNRLTIINNSDDTIFFDLPKDGHFTENPLKTDSIQGDTLWNYMRYVLPKKSTTIPLMGKNKWEEHINKYFKDSTLHVFFFNKQLLDSLNPDYLVSNQLYTKRISYKVEDLKTRDWKVVYEN